MTKPSRRAPRGAPDPANRRTTASTSPNVSRPTGTRAGRRERPRTGYARRSFLERFRAPLMALAVLAGAGLIGAFMFNSVSASSWACSTEWQPEPTPSPDPGESPDFGYVQPDMGRDHTVNRPQRYTYCPPASGSHFNRVGQGPIEPRVYGPEDVAQPQGWVHNLEHGALVLLYRCDEGDAGCDEATQDELRNIFTGFPNSPVCNLAPGGVGPVIARFDEMAYPYAALVWGRVLPLETLDVPLIHQFWAAEGERTNPEPQCAPPSTAPSAAPSASAAPSGSAAPSAPASGAASPSAPASPAASVAASPAASPAASGVAPSPSAS